VITAAAAASAAVAAKMQFSNFSWSVFVSQLLLLLLLFFDTMIAQVPRITENPYAGNRGVHCCSTSSAATIYIQCVVYSSSSKVTHLDRGQ
jgi:hypothetical protein